MAAKKARPAPPRRTPGKTGIETFTGNARPERSPDDLRKLISEAAYYRAKQRGFAPGHELEDWVQAEADIMRRIGGRANRSL